MKKTNYHAGPRGINLDNGSTYWVEPGQEVTLHAKDKDGNYHVDVPNAQGETEKLKVKGDLPDFGKASDQADKDAAEVEVLRARVAELEAAAAKTPAK